MLSEINKTVFFDIPTLSEYSPQLGYRDLYRTWFKGVDHRYFGESLQKFIVYNRELFKFLNIRPNIYSSGKNAMIGFSSGQFIGAIPLRSPKNGMQIGDFIVTPRFSSGVEDLFSYGELITLLESEITPEFIYSLPLKSRNSVKPPQYIQASKFIQLLYGALKTNDWVRFQNRLNLLKEPKSEIAWKKYIETEYDPYRKLIFPCRENILTQQHKEFYEIVYVYQLARKEVVTTHTPIQIRVQLDRILSSIDQKLAGIPQLESREIRIHQFDFPIIKQLKEQANVFLSNSFKEVTGWRIDLSQLYERYIQYVFGLASRELNIHQVNNHRISRTAFNPPDWSLKYIEPDLVLLGNRFSIIVDAKYKSHFYNLHQKSEFLYEEHRQDLHQILAYSSFIQQKNKYLMICYPFTSFSKKVIEYGSNLLQSKVKIILVGIPVKASEVDSIKDNLIELIDSIETTR